jgi:hypothetical protein
MISLRTSDDLKFLELINYTEGWEKRQLELSLTKKIHNHFFHPLVKKKIWNGDICYSWDFTVAMFEYFGIVPVKVLYCGIYDEKIIKNIYKEYIFLKIENNFTGFEFEVIKPLLTEIGISEEEKIKIGF